MIPSLTVVSLYGPALSFCKSGRIFLALLNETTFWGKFYPYQLQKFSLVCQTWKIIKIARRITINPKRLVHSLGDASPPPRPALQIMLKVKTLKWKYFPPTWRSICIGEAQVWLLRGFAPSPQLWQTFEIAAGCGAAIGESGVGEQVALLRAREHVQHWGDLGSDAPSRSFTFILIGET